MGRINSRAKGASGEREFCEWLEKNFNLPEKPKRELGQARDSGADVMCPPFAFEVKRREKLDLLEWWAQVKRAVINKDCTSFGLEPVVAFRQNGQKWEFLISGEYIGINGGWIRLTEVAFKKWVAVYLENLNNGAGDRRALQESKTTGFIRGTERGSISREIPKLELR